MNRPADADTADDAPGPARPVALVSVLIVNYNAWPDVSGLVASLAASAEVRSGLCEVIVVDNASHGPVPPSLRDPRSRARLILRTDNGGFAVGVNAGWHASHAPWLLLINPDVVADAGFLGRVVARLRPPEAADAPGVVGFALRNPGGTPQPSVGAFPSLLGTLREQLIPRSRRKYQPAWRTRPGPVDWVTGACLLVNARLMKATGGLDEDFFLYYEEVAFCRTARALGWRVEYDPGIEVVHLRPLQDRPVTPRMRVITRHSKLLYFRKHLPRWQFLGLCAVVAAEANVLGLWARLTNRTDDARSWRTVARVERALRSGVELRGLAVRELADAVTQAGTTILRPPSPTRPPAPTPPPPPEDGGIGPTGGGHSPTRKEGPACRRFPRDSESPC